MLPWDSIFQYGFLGGGQFKKIPQRVDFLTKKWGFNQENPQKQDFSHYLGQYSREGLQSSRNGSQMGLIQRMNSTDMTAYFVVTKKFKFSINNN